MTVALPPPPRHYFLAYFLLKASTPTISAAADGRRTSSALAIWVCLPRRSCTTAPTASPHPWLKCF